MPLTFQHARSSGGLCQGAGLFLGTLEAPPLSRKISSHVYIGSQYGGQIWLNISPLIKGRRYFFGGTWHLGG